jgi:hypothetical protein
MFEGWTPANTLTVVGGGLVTVIQWATMRADMRQLQKEVDSLKTDRAEDRLRMRDYDKVLSRMEASVEYIRDLLDRRLPRNTE